MELLLTRALGIDRVRLVAHPELGAAAADNPRYLAWIERRLAGEPVAYILGEREFYGLALHVTPAVLIPRPETELLVDLALARIPENKPCDILDLGTGSGCIAVVIAQARPLARVVASDLSRSALEVAQRNAQRHGLRNIEVQHGDWFEPLAGERFELIVSNPPYVAAGDPHLRRGDLRFEPAQALTGGTDGLALLRDIVAQAAAYLASDGWLLLEHGYDQADALAASLREAGYRDLMMARDLAGLPRVSGGCRPHLG